MTADEGDVVALVDGAADDAAELAAGLVELPAQPQSAVHATSKRIRFMVMRSPRANRCEWETRVGEGMYHPRITRPARLQDRAAVEEAARVRQSVRCAFPAPVGPDRLAALPAGSLVRDRSRGGASQADADHLRLTGLSDPRPTE